MKILSNKYLPLFLILLTFFSCSKDDGIIGLEEPSYNYFVNSKKISSLQLPTLQLMYTQAAFLYPEAEVLKTNLKYSVEVNKMTYKTKLGNKNIQASGLICVPEKAGSYPVLCFQNGTNVLHDKAPTENPGDQLFTLLESIASMGYIVVVPDYPGFGESDNDAHPYLIKDYTVQALTDILKSTVEYTNESTLNISLNNDLYLMGYSQGGWATMQLQREIETNGLEPFNLVASSCGAGPYNISNINNAMLVTETYSQPYFLAYIVNSYNEYEQFGSGISIGDIFNEPYATEVPDLFDGMHSASEINSSLTTTIADLFTNAYLTGAVSTPKYEPVRNAFVSNSVEPWQVKTPTLMLHGTDDMTVPFTTSSTMYQALIQAGSSEDVVTFVPIPEKGHTEAIVPYGFASIKWILEK